MSRASVLGWDAERAMMERLAPISDYALLGDTRTAALSAPSGAIEWLCLPRFDSPPVFGSLVGGPQAGSFVVAPVGPVSGPTRRYTPGSTVATTRWELDGGRVTLTEGMVVAKEHTLFPASTLVRQLSVEGAPQPVQVLFAPRFGLNRQSSRPSVSVQQTVCRWPGFALALSTSYEARIVPEKVTELVVYPGRPLVLALSSAFREPLVYVDPHRAADALATSDRWWQESSNGVRNMGPFHDAALRSLITLRLLTYSPSGAPVAAPTTSLPEVLGGDRNWDYRFAWPRDASIGIAALLNAGKVEEARAFMYWLLHATRLDRPRIPALLTLDGRRVPAEQILAEWPGYAESRPVRVGNDARDQHQLDVYGWVLDAAWLLTQHNETLFGETWRALSDAADLVARRWAEPDAGLWEVRGEPRHYVHSKLMAWLALDRALRIAGTRRTRSSRVRRWAVERGRLAAEIRGRGFDEQRHSYTWSYGSRELDAALLILPLLDFDDPTSSRVHGTIDAVRRELAAGGPLLYRYPPQADGMAGREGAFLPCSFWLAQALARVGRVDEAAAVFEALLAYAGDLGLFAEEAEPVAGAMIGNYPQAFTHATLVQAALAIRDAIEPSARTD